MRSPASSTEATCSPFRSGVTSRTARRSEEHTSELQSRLHLVCRLLLEKKKDNRYMYVDGKKSASNVIDWFVSMSEQLLDVMAYGYHVFTPSELHIIVCECFERVGSWL